LGALEELQRRYGSEVAFFVVYIKEAHPEDGWVLNRNRDARVRVDDPTSDEQRADIAETCARRMRLTLPVLVDGIDNATSSAYGGWPDRLYLIGRHGHVAFQGDEGPFGFKPAELEAAIRAELGQRDD
jgi:Iodothyronine deiodinase